MNYYGTDPNYKLTEVLNTYQKDFKSVYDTYNEVHIYTMGSEFFIPELENKVGLCFSSPPYFNLEKYACGKQSYVEGITSYDAWRDDYLEPTIQNCYKYLIDDGYFICNIKNFDVYNLEDDLIKLSIDCGFKLHKIEILNGATHVSGKQSSKDVVKTDMSENIYVFVKNSNNTVNIKEKINLW